MRASNLIFLILSSVIFAGCEKIFIGSQPENTPLNNYNLLWKSLDENYAMFGVKKIDWDSLNNIYGTQINESTTEYGLWNLCSSLIAELDDGHVCLLNKKRNKAAQSGKILITRKPDDFSLDLVKSKFLQNIKIVGAGNITYGMFRTNNTGYIHIATFVWSGSGNWAYDIDKAVNELSGSDALIVDVRNNNGGLILNESIIGSAFTDHKITYFNSQVKTGPGHNEFGELRPVSVEPRAGVKPFSGKIALLTNRYTASGGEYMAQLFINLPNSTQIGDTTMGAFGEITCTRELPNGWTFTYPCTLTTFPEGGSPEGIGIIPDILIENTKAEIDSGKDNALEYALQFLNK